MSTTLLKKPALQLQDFSGLLAPLNREQESPLRKEFSIPEKHTYGSSRRSSPVPHPDSPALREIQSVLAGQPFSDLSESDLASMVTMIQGHNKNPVAGGEGYGARYLVARLLSHPGLTAHQLHQLLIIPAVGEGPCMTERDLSQQALLHPHCDDELYVTIMMAYAANRNRVFPPEMVESPVDKALLSFFERRVNAIKWGQPVPYHTTTTALAVRLRQAGTPTLEVFEAFLGDNAAAANRDFTLVVELLEAALNTAS